MRQLQRQGLHGRGADEENEGAGGPGRRRPAGPAAAGRTALTAAPQPAASLPDARPASLVMRLTPDFALPFVQLARLDRPIGWQLLLAPCWQATALAGLALHRGPNLWHLLLFLVGAIAMRGAGCTYNDILDRKLDAEVERTRNRPLAGGPGHDRRGGGVPRRSGAGRPRGAPLLQPVLDRARDRLARRRCGLPADEAGDLVAAGGARPRLLVGSADGLERDIREPRAGPDPALPLRLRLDDRLRHDLRAAGRARRRHRRHPLDRAPVRSARASSASASSMPRARRWLLRRSNSPAAA